LPIKPKQHLSIHFPSVVRRNGQPTYNSCFKYELQNSFFKKGAYNICNFKNNAMSLAIGNQLSALSHSVNKSRSRDLCLTTHTFTASHLSTLHGCKKIIDKFFLNQNDTILCSVKAKILGKQNSKGNFVAIRQRPVDKMIEFGQVRRIIWIGKEAYLIVKLFQTLDQDNSIHAYNLKEET
jgi:hypothetical protein